MESDKNLLGIVFKWLCAKYLFYVLQFFYFYFPVDFKSTKQQKKDTKKPTPNKNTDDADVIDLVDDDLEL